MTKRNLATITILLAFFTLQAGVATRAADNSSDAKKAAAGVLQRILPTRAAEFQIEVLPAAEKGRDVFEIEGEKSGPVIRGNNANSILAGVNWYLKYFCNAQLTWTGDQLNLPNPLPKPKAKVRIVSPYKYRYIYNYCTFNYTMSFWGWKEWERELDWLALNGINLALSVNGQEAVWQNVMRRMGMSEKEISDFIPGPAFQAWWLMGNLEGWGGPVSQAWIDSRAALQKKILARMHELGIEPVLQGFYGMAPRAMIKDFPDAKIYETGLWGEFNRPAIVNPLDPFFNKLAAVWYDEQKKLYGDARFFGGDPFHEGGGADIDLTKAGTAIQNAMLAARPDSVWVLQGWQSNPRKELLDGTKKENTLILDLYAETAPQWSSRDAFYGHPWIWNIISNFGGNIGMFGTLGKVARDPVEALNNPKHGNYEGIGAMMEASMTDVILWDLLFEMGWRSESPNLDKWVQDYALRRYGNVTPGIAQAWKILEDTAYGAPNGGGAEPESPMCARPGIDVKRVCGPIARTYDMCEFARAWKLFVDDAEKYRGSETFAHDLVDVSRQSLANLSVYYMDAMSRAYKAKDKDSFVKYSNKFLELILDQDQLLATGKHFLLGKWISDARALGSTDAERDLFEWNARTQITVWGPRASAGGLHEYANKEWSGLLRGFYYMRWKLFIDNVTANFDIYVKGKKVSGKDAFNSAINAINSGEKAGIDPTGIDWFAVEEKWTKQNEKYSPTPVGDPIAEAKRVFDKYYEEASTNCKLK